MRKRKIMTGTDKRSHRVWNDATAGREMRIRWWIPLHAARLLVRPHDMIRNGLSSPGLPRSFDSGLERQVSGLLGKGAPSENNLLLRVLCQILPCFRSQDRISSTAPVWTRQGAVIRPLCHSPHPIRDRRGFLPVPCGGTCSAPRPAPASAWPDPCRSGRPR